MNREQAKKALLAIDENALGWIDLNDLGTSIREAEEGTDPEETSSASAREAYGKMLAVLRQHRDFLRTEDDALAVWREVFVAQCKADPMKLSPSYLPTKVVDTAKTIADGAEAEFRRRLAEHLKAKG